MESRYNRPSSPRGRYNNPGRASTGTFGDPYYDSSYYVRPSSPRSSVDRIGGSKQTYYTPNNSSSSRTNSLKYDSYTGRPRRNTNDHTSRPNVSSLTSLPIRTPYSPHSHLDRPASPLSQSWDKRADTYITPGPSRREHKKVYSVDDSSHKTQLVAERELIEPSRHRDSVDRGYNLTSGGRSYHNSSKPPPRLTDLNDDGYSYTDPASMYRDTEPAWRRPRAGSMDRSRPTSMILDRSTRPSAREPGPPPSTRGFDKINNAIPRPHGRAPSIERAREIPKYDPYPDTAPTRSSSTRQHAPAIHQEPREHRRDTYHDDYDRRDREVENKRHSTGGRFEDREVASRGFGIAPAANPNVTHDHHALDRQPILYPQEAVRARPQEPTSQYYTTDRAIAQMPEPRVSRERDVAPPQDNYEKRPRERESSRQEPKGFVPAAAGAAAGVAATLGAAGYMKSRDKERERESERDSSAERERERRREHDERDRRDRALDERRDDRRDRRPDERREPLPPPPPPSSATVGSAPVYAPSREDDRKPRERRHQDDERERSSRKPPSSEGSGDERPRHYVERDSERRKESAPKETALDPDEEYRRRVQQEAERSSRVTRDRDYSDSDREQDRRRRKDERDRSRGPEDRSRGPPPNTKEPASSRYDERSSSIYDANLVQEPDSLEGALVPTSKSVQIVTPPKEAPPAVKGILRKPTQKFPEDPEPIREGVAPHKDALKGKDIPVGARWTRIDRRLVNPEALEQAKERFEERMDCVIVLRVLTKQEIQKLADRTKKIREAREDDERHDRDDRDRRSHRSSRDDREDEDRDRDRERRRRYDDESDYDDLDREYQRERDRDRDRSKVLEPVR